MKKQLLLICIALLSYVNADAQDTASWNGSVSSDWNNAANWTWTNGNGVPDANDDVIINHGANYAHVTSNTVASCRNLKISEGINNYVSLYLDDSATLNVYGNITKGYDGSIITPGPLYKSTTLNLLGTGDQFLKQTQLTVGTINIDKPSGNVYLPDELRDVYIFNSINLKGTSVPLDSTPVGNLYLNNASIKFDEENAIAKINTPAYLDNEIPPHIIMNTNSSAIYFMRDFTGYKFVPISDDVKSFNPVTIHSTAESWFVAITTQEGDNCDSIRNLPDAVKKTWLIMPTTHELGKQNSSNPATVSFTFHVNNSEDVPSSFKENYNRINIFQKKFMSACWSNIASSPIPDTGGYVTVQTPYISQFYKFMLAPDTMAQPEEVGINDFENTLSKIGIYPNPVNNELTFDLSSFSNRQLEITISDALGKVLYKTTLAGNKPNTYKVNMQNFSPGLYFIRLSDEAFTETKKVIKR